MLPTTVKDMAWYKHAYKRERARVSRYDSALRLERARRNALEQNLKDVLGVDNLTYRTDIGVFTA